MEVILSKDVKSLGQTGDVVKVKDGYARNYLFPRQMAHPATKGNLLRIEHQKKARQQQYEQAKKEALIAAEKFAKLSCTLNVEANENDKLYGAVTDAEIVAAIEAEGQAVDRKQIVIEKPIEEVGIYEIGIKLHSEVTAKVRLWVTKK